MSKVMKDLIAKKIKDISPEELLHYSKKYGFSLSQTEANQITTYVQGHPFDPFKESDRINFFKELTRMTNMDTTRKAQRLFSEIVKSYGIQSLF